MTNRSTFYTFLLFFFISSLSLGISYPTFAYVTYDPNSLISINLHSSIAKGLTLGFLLALAPAVSFLTCPAIGRLADEKGKKKILLACVVVLCVSQLLTALSLYIGSPTILFVARAFNGLGSGGSVVISSIIANISEPKEKAKNFAFLSAASSLGLIIGPVSAGGLSQKTITLPFLVAALILLFNLLLIASLYKEDRSSKSETQSLRQDIQLVLGCKKIQWLLVAMLLFMAGWIIYWQFMSVNWITEYAFTLSQVGIFYTYGAIWAILSSAILIHPLLAKFQSLPLITASCFALSLLTIVVVIWKSYPLFWVIIPLQQFCFALLGPSAIAFFSNTFQKSQQGTVMGVLQSIFSLVLVIAPLLGGISLAAGNDLHITLGAGLTFFSSLLLAFRYREALRHPLIPK